MSRMTSLLAASLAAVIGASASASIIGFVEGFDTDSASWRNGPGTTDLDWFASGGPNGSAYASSLFNLSGTQGGGFPATVIRAQVGFGSSGGAYAGNWIEAGVIGVSFDFRHDLPEPIQVTGRFATPMNFPGASTETSLFVLPGVWTTVFFDLTEGSADIISLGGGTYQGIFGNLGNIQIGFNVSLSLAGQNIDGRFDIDNFRVIPAPGALALTGLLGFGGLGRRRRRA